MDGRGFDSFTRSFALSSRRQLVHRLVCSGAAGLLSLVGLTEIEAIACRATATSFQCCPGGTTCSGKIGDAASRNSPLAVCPDGYCCKSGTNCDKNCCDVAGSTCCGDTAPAQTCG